MGRFERLVLAATLLGLAVIAALSGVWMKPERRRHDPVDVSITVQAQPAPQDTPAVHVTPI